MLSRRQFTASALTAAVFQTAEKATAQSVMRTIVDAQVHLWKAESEDWKWVPGMTPQMPEPFTVEKLIPLMIQVGVDRVVVVPPSWPGDRNDYALDAARRYPSRFAVMGRIPLNYPQAAARLLKWREQPGMLGVRLTFLGPAKAWLTDGTPDWFWPQAEKANLPVMFLTDGQKPSEESARKKSDAVRRARKLARKEAIRDGLIAAPARKKTQEIKQPGTSPRRA